MAVQILPGFWDQIGPYAGKFFDNLQRAAAPDFYANQRLQEMAQQNPAIMQQIANMGREEQQALATSLGFRKQNPFQAIPEGVERQDKLQSFDLKKKGIANDPEGAAATAAGARTKAQQAVAAFQPVIAGQNVKKGEQEIVRNDQMIEAAPFQLAKTKLDNESAQIILDQRKSALARLDELKTQYPDVNPMEIVQRIFAGDKDPTVIAQFERLYLDPNFKGPLEILMDTEKLNQNRKLNFQLRIAGKQDDQEATMNRLLERAVVDARQAYKDAETNVFKVLGGNMMSKIQFDAAVQADPKFKGMYDAAKALADERKAHYENLRNKLSAKFGPDAIPPLDILPDVVDTQADDVKRRLEEAKRRAGLIK